MTGLINMQERSARKRDPNKEAPSRILNRPALDTALFHVRRKCVDVVAQEIQLVVRNLSIGFMNGRLGCRQPKDHITTAGVDRRKFKNVPEERMVRLGVLAREYCVC